MLERRLQMIEVEMGDPGSERREDDRRSDERRSARNRRVGERRVMEDRRRTVIL